MMKWGNDDFLNWFRIRCNPYTRSHQDYPLADGDIGEADVEMKDLRNKAIILWDFLLLRQGYKERADGTVFLIERDKVSDAIQSAINLMEQVEKVEGVLPEEIETESKLYNSGWNALLHQVKLNLVKAGLVRKPKGEEMDEIIWDAIQCVLDKGKLRQQEGLEETLIELEIPKKVAKAIVDRLEEER